MGEPIRGQRDRVLIDKHGDSVQATNTLGNHFRKRHDYIKMMLYNLCKWAGLPAEMEVYNLFSRLIPQQGLTRYERNRKRQAIIPELHIVIPVGRESKSVLQEIKVISVSQTRYQPTWEERGIDRRADELHNEYVNKARRVDTLYCETQPGQVGPIEAKLLSYERVRGLVFGAFG